MGYKEKIRIFKGLFLTNLLFTNSFLLYSTSKVPPVGPDLVLCEALDNNMVIIETAALMDALKTVAPSVNTSKEFINLRTYIENVCTSALAPEIAESIMLCRTYFEENKELIQNIEEREALEYLLTKLERAILRQPVFRSNPQNIRLDFNAGVIGIDTTNNRFGVNTQSPQTDCDVQNGGLLVTGTSRLQSTLTLNANIIPSSNNQNLGDSSNCWQNMYTTTLFGHNETLTGNLSVQGNMSVEGTYISATSTTPTFTGFVAITATPEASGCLIFADSANTTTVTSICAPDLLNPNYYNLNQALSITVNQGNTESISIDTSGNVTVYENLTVNGSLTVSGTSTCTSVNITTGGATFTGTTNVNGSLSQSGGNVTFDNTNTLFINETNHRIGILNNAPQYALSVTGTTNTSALITAGAVITGTLTQSGGDANFNDMLVIDETNHRVGVLNSTPQYTLDITGTMNTSAVITTSLTITDTLTQSGGMVTLGNTLFINETNHRIGILNSTPQYTLDVTGTINATTLITAGAVITSTLTQSGGTVTLGGAVTVTGNILPSTSSEYNLGAPLKHWDSIYTNSLSATDVTISGNLAVGGNMYVNGTLVTENSITQTYLGTLTILAPIGGSACFIFSDQTETNTLATICAQNPSNPGSPRGLTINPYDGALLVTGTILPSGIYDLGSVSNSWNTLFAQNVNLSNITGSNAISITAGSNDNISIGSGAVRSTRAPCTGTTTDGLTFNLSENGAITASATGQTAGTGYGCNSVDLQMGRSASNQVARGPHATILGGHGNIAWGNYSFSAGQNAHGTTANSFTWSDGTTYSNAQANRFNVCAENGLFVQGGTTGTATISATSGTTSSHLTIDAGTAGANPVYGRLLILTSGATSGDYALTGTLTLTSATAPTREYIQTGSCVNLGFPRPPAGGPIKILGGDGASSIALKYPSSGAGGAITISAGNGGTTTNTVGSSASSCPYGGGGSITMTTGNGGYSIGASSNEVPGNGGNFTITAGNGGNGGRYRNISGTGGSISLTAGSGGSSGGAGAGGSITLTAGAGTNGGAAGSVNVTSNFTQSAGTVNIGSDSTAHAINIGTGTTGSGRTITIGATGNTTVLNGAVTIQNLTITSATIQNLIITGTTTMTGATAINTSGNANTSIGLTNTAHVGIGGSAGTGTTTLLVSGTTRIVGDLNVTSTITAGSGLIVTTGGATINGSVNALTSNFTITGTFTQSDGVVSLGADNTPNTINIGTGNAVKTIHIGDNNTPANSIAIGGTNSTTTISGALSMPILSSLVTTGAITAGSGLTVTTGGATIGGALSAGNTTINGTLGATGNTTISGSMIVGVGQDCTFDDLIKPLGISSGGFSLGLHGNGPGGEIFYNTSSRRYKDNIRPMGEYSSLIYQLNPSLFTCKKDSAKQLNAGLIAEEVEKVMPEMVLYMDGQVESIRYDEFISLLLNEIQKSARHINELQKEVSPLDRLEKIAQDLLAKKRGALK